MKFQYYTKSVAGNFRKNNQDSAYAKALKTAAGQAFLGIVCDGMGGLSHGELASGMAVKAFAEWFEQEFRFVMSGGDISEVVFAQWAQIISSVNANLRNISAENGALMGTTLSAVLVFDGMYYSAQIGDSRVYMLSGDEIIQITRDHSYVADMARAGLMTENEMNSSKQKNIITRCVGVKDNVYADGYHGVLADTGAFLLCSDGFCSGLDEKGMRELLDVSSLKKTKIKRTIDNAVKRRMDDGEKDNITALLVRWQ